MEITRDIVIDLLPLYESGEASPDTRAAVEEFLRHDPSLKTMSMEAVAAPPAPADNAERTAVERTRQRLRRRSWTFAIALFCTLLPLSFGQLEDGISFVMFRDVPWSRALWLPAAGLWLHHFYLGRHGRTAGL